MALLEEGLSVHEELLRLLEEYASVGKQIHGANLVATARAHSVGRIVTANAHDFTRFAGVLEIVPLDSV